MPGPVSAGKKRSRKQQAAGDEHREHETDIDAMCREWGEVLRAVLRRRLKG